MKEISIRIADKNDAPALIGIYAPYINDTAITFEYVVPPVEEFASRIQVTTHDFPWLVCEIDGKPAGYAYASHFKTRAAFQWDAEMSVYLSSEFHRLGIASALYNCLENILREQGYLNLYALITHPNPVSEGFHASRGYRQVGIYHSTGFKFDKWHDLIVLEKQLAPLPAVPAPCRTFHELDKDFFSEQLHRAEEKIRSKMNS